MGEIEADAAPAAIGPYSHGAVNEDRIFVSGRGHVDWDSGEVAGISNYGAVNEVSAEYMSDPSPVRSAIKGVDLPIEISAEIEVSASK